MAKFKIFGKIFQQSVSILEKLGIYIYTAELLVKRGMLGGTCSSSQEIMVNFKRKLVSLRKEVSDKLGEQAAQTPKTSFPPKHD